MALKIGDKVLVLDTSSSWREQYNQKAIVVNKFKNGVAFCLKFEKQIGHTNYKGVGNESYYKKEEDHLYEKGNFYFWYYNEQYVKKITQEIKVFEDD